jgi:hypothetical protein
MKKEPVKQSKSKRRNKPWRDAIVEVLSHYDEGVHYSTIAQDIVDKRLRIDVGATPATTVNTYISGDIKDMQDASIFLRVGKGLYMLRNQSRGSGMKDNQDGDNNASGSAAIDGVIRAFGMYWRRDAIDWAYSTPKLLGVQQRGAKPVDFAKQIGVYMLHDVREVVYVGRTTTERLSQRLLDHTTNRLSGRWDRFSWFGMLDVNDDSSIVENSFDRSLSVEVVAIALEAILIEGLEPRQNRRRGDGFNATEYLQIVDPKLRERTEREIIRRLAESHKIDP